MKASDVFWVYFTSTFHLLQDLRWVLYILTPMLSNVPRWSEVSFSHLVTTAILNTLWETSVQCILYNILLIHKTWLFCIDLHACKLCFMHIMALTSSAYHRILLHNRKSLNEDWPVADFNSILWRIIVPIGVCPWSSDKKCDICRKQKTWKCLDCCWCFYFKRCISQKLDQDTCF